MATGGIRPLLAVLIIFALLAVAGGRAQGAGHVVSFQVDEPGQVSLGIYDADGVLQRSLLVGEPMEPGVHQLQWDGLDRWGNALPPGDYNWRMVRTPGFEATYLLNVGTNPRSEPWHVWVGNHHGVTALAVDGDDMYVGSGNEENVPALIKQSLDGTQRHWAHRRFEPWMGPESIGIAADRVYFFQRNAKIHITGTEISERGRYEGDIKSSEKLGTWNMLWPGDEVEGYGTLYADLMDMDARDDSVAVVWKEHDTIRWFEPITGNEPQIQAESNVVAPRAVTLGADGTAYLISEGEVVWVPRGGEPETFIEANHLTEPRHIALDRSTGQLFVAEAAPSHQIKKFDSQGSLLNTYGRYGGREYGPYVIEDFLNINDITADGRGGFLVAEGRPTLHRTAHVAPDGSVINTWYGPQQFFNFSTPDPANPNRVIFMGGYGDKTLAEADYQARTWRVIANYRHHNFGGLFPSSIHYHIQWHARRRDGQLYLLTGSNAGPAVLRVDEQAGKLLPVAVAGRVNRNDPPEMWNEIIEHHGYDDPADAPVAYTWSDRNGNGQFDPEEFILGGSIPGLVGYVDEDWNVMLAQSNPRAHDGVAWFTLNNIAENAAGPPAWDWNRLEPGPGRLPDTFLHLGGVDVRAIHTDDADNVYVFLAANRHPSNDRHGEGWPTNRSGSSRLVKWNAQGEIQWVTGRHALINPHKVEQRLPAGRFHDPARLLGVVNETIIYADRVRNPAAAFTTDGLYAGSFFDRRADDGLPPHLYAWWRDPQTRHPDTLVPYDCLTGGSILQLDEDTVLWMPMGENSTPVYHVRGWKGWQRHEGTIHLDHRAMEARGEGSGLAAHYFATPDLAGEPALERIDGQVWFTERWQPWETGELTDPENFSARWIGQVEAHFAEDYVFSVYTNRHGRARLWLDGELILEYWPEQQQQSDPRQQVTWERLSESTSDPIPLEPGSMHSIMLEYSNQTGTPWLSLNWDTFTQERQRIPERFLYPAGD